MNYLKFIAVSALTGGVVLLSYAEDSLDKTPADKIDSVDKKSDKISLDKKTDKPLSEKKARKIEKNSTAANREERPLLMYMDKLSPEDRAKLKELYLQDPEKFRKELRSKIQELRKQESGGQKNINEIAGKYHKAQTHEEKQKYLAQLKETSKKEFYHNLERSKTELDTLEKRLNTLRQAYENRKNNADKIVDDQVEYLTRDSSLHW
jgi:exonuclease VII large subunit